MASLFRCLLFRTLLYWQNWCGETFWWFWNVKDSRQISNFKSPKVHKSKKTYFFFVAKNLLKIEWHKTTVNEGGVCDGGGAGVNGHFIPFTLLKQKGNCFCSPDKRSNVIITIEGSSINNNFYCTKQSLKILLHPY